MSQDHSKEQQVLAVMRQVLGSIIKDTTPPHRGMKHPLSDGTITDIRQCLLLITAREKEIREANGEAMEKPYFTDDVTAVKTISIDSLKKKN